MGSSINQTLPKSYVFYLYTFQNGPALKASHGAKIIEIAETDLTSNSTPLSERPFVYLSPAQLEQLPEALKANHAFVNFLKGCSFMIKPEDLPQDAFKKDHEFNSGKAMELLKLAADEGYSLAQRSLAVCYYWRKDWAEALRYFRLAADQGSIVAQYNLAIHYMKGDGVQQSWAEAVKHLKLAAGLGLRDAQFNLSLCYARGHGVGQDLAEAVRYLKLAADQNLPQAHNELGLYSEIGKGVPWDLAEAARRFKLAAGQGMQAAQVSLERVEAALQAQSIPNPRVEPTGIARQEENLDATDSTEDLEKPGSDDFRRHLYAEQRRQSNKIEHRGNGLNVTPEAGNKSDLSVRLQREDDSEGSGSGKRFNRTNRQPSKKVRSSGS